MKNTHIRTVGNTLKGASEIVPQQHKQRDAERFYFLVVGINQKETKMKNRENKLRFGTYQYDNLRIDVIWHDSKIIHIIETKTEKETFDFIDTIKKGEKNEARNM